MSEYMDGTVLMDIKRHKEASGDDYGIDIMQGYADIGETRHTFNRRKILNNTFSIIMPEKCTMDNGGSTVGLTLEGLYTEQSEQYCYELEKVVFLLQTVTAETDAQTLLEADRRHICDTFEHIHLLGDFGLKNYKRNAEYYCFREILEAGNLFHFVFFYPTEAGMVHGRFVSPNPASDSFSRVFIQMAESILLP